jgi:hypothetical protein
VRRLDARYLVDRLAGEVGDGDRRQRAVSVAHEDLDARQRALRDGIDVVAALAQKEKRRA